MLNFCKKQNCQISNNSSPCPPPFFFSCFFLHVFALLFLFRLRPFPGHAHPHASPGELSCAGKHRSGLEVTQNRPKTPQKKGFTSKWEQRRASGGGWRDADVRAASWSFPRRKRDDEPASYLKWVAFEGKLPTDAVSNWNSYAKRMEYVCSTQTLGCNTGAYVPDRGPFCFFPYGERELSSHNFKVLVNEGGFEVLDWVDSSFGGVPENAVEGCPSIDVFIGRNHYGLGKVSKVQRAAFVVVDGEEVWYKWYQVLVVKKSPADVTISDVLYNMSGAVESREDVTLMKTTVRNEGCRGVRKAVTLEEAVEVEHNWQMDQRIFTTINGVLQSGLLAFSGMGWEVTNVTNIPWVGGASTSEYVVHTHEVEEELQPRTACVVALEGRRLDIRVPFTAQLTRDFGDGQLHHVAATGRAHSRVVVGVRASVKHCWPITDVPPCQA